MFGVNSLKAQEQKNYTIKQTSKKIKIDGILNEDAWNEANMANNFTQTIPSPDKPSLYNTEVKMLYSETSIYIGAVLYEPATTQLKQMTARDELTRCNADVFSVFLDTYHDLQNGFAFRVSSAGVQQDERLSGGVENGDVTWDAVWNSKVTTYHDKWIVEIEIPYSAIRFSKLKEQIWGLNFGRLVRKVNENSFWNAIDVQKQGFLIQAGVITGLQNIHPPVRLFLYPYLSAGYYHKPNEDGTTQTGFLKSGGVDIKYGINESFTIDATLIPNFSQVVSDNIIRNLSPFEQQLTENRPFFTEGTELFNKTGIFYTRRVGARPKDYYVIENNFGNDSLFDIKKNPNVTTLLNAVKFSGRNKKNVGIGIFNAIGSPMYATIFDKQNENIFKQKTEPLANYNVIVIDKPLRGQSFINFTNTNILKNGITRDANVSAISWQQFSKSEKYALQIAGKISTQHENNFVIGTSLYTSFFKTMGKLRYSVNTNFLSPQYSHADMGIQFDYNEMSQQIAISYYENKPKIKFLQAYKLSTSHTITENVKPYVFKFYKATASYFWLFKNFWDITYEIESMPFTPTDFYQLRAFGKQLKNNMFVWNGVGGSSDSRKKLFWNFYVGYGFSNNYKTGYFYADQGLRYLLKNKLEFAVKGTMTRDDGNIGFSFYDPTINQPIVASRFVREYEGIVSIKYNYSPTVNFTARLRHYNTFITNRSFHTVNAKGEWRQNNYPYVLGMDENFNLQNIDVFFNWMFKPGSRLVLSYKQWLQNAYILNSKQNNSYYNNVYEVIKTTQAFEVTARLIYFLDYNQVKAKNSYKKY